MEKSNAPQSVDAYLDGLSETQKARLEQLRIAIKALAPNAKEIISYQMPTFQYKGKILLHFAAFKKHYSLFPGKAPIEAFKNDLKTYKTSAGTIQMPFDQDFPHDVLRKIVAMRMGDIEFTLENKKKK